jgi:hypothetical protein
MGSFSSFIPAPGAANLQVSLAASDGPLKGVIPEGSETCGDIQKTYKGYPAFIETAPAPIDDQASKEKNMSEANRIKYLSIALLLVGLIFIVGIYPLTILWPSGWAWHTGLGVPHYLQMILGVYATLGIFLLVASRNPLAHLSLIWFTVWSSVVHAGIMAVQSLANPEHMGHLWGDVLALFAAGAVLALLTPRGAPAKLAQVRAA